MKFDVLTLFPEMFNVLNDFINMRVENVSLMEGEYCKNVIASSGKLTKETIKQDQSQFQQETQKKLEEYQQQEDERIRRQAEGLTFEDEEVDWDEFKIDTGSETNSAPRVTITPAE